MHKYIL